MYISRLYSRLIDNFYYILDHITKEKFETKELCKKEYQKKKVKG